MVYQTSVDDAVRVHSQRYATDILDVDTVPNHELYMLTETFRQLSVAFPKFQRLTLLKRCRSRLHLVLRVSSLKRKASGHYASSARGLTSFFAVHIHESPALIYRACRFLFSTLNCAQISPSILFSEAMTEAHVTLNLSFRSCLVGC